MTESMGFARGESSPVKRGFSFTNSMRVHELPGTTVPNPAERRTYDSDQAAGLTLSELERWLAPAVVSYHGQYPWESGLHTDDRSDPTLPELSKRAWDSFDIAVEAATEYPLIAK
ncbi:hypothetical protein ABIB27_000623 [Arthrobacter sp. UYEF21]